MAILENIDIDRAVLENIDIDIDKEILENIDIDKEISENIDIDKILNRLEFGISNRATSLALSLSPPASPASNHRHHRLVKGLGELPNEKHHHCHVLQVLPLPTLEPSKGFLHSLPSVMTVI